MYESGLKFEPWLEKQITIPFLLLAVLKYGFMYWVFVFNDPKVANYFGYHVN